MNDFSFVYIIYHVHEIWLMASIDDELALQHFIMISMNWRTFNLLRSNNHLGQLNCSRSNGTFYFLEISNFLSAVRVFVVQNQTLYCFNY